MNSLQLMPFILLVSTHLFAGQSRPCTLAGFQELCAQIPQNDQPYIQLPDGGRFRNPRLRGADLGPTSPDLVTRGRSRLEQKFAIVRRKMVDEILAGRPRSEMTQDQKMFIDRIESMKLDVKTEDCAQSPSGNYSSASNEVQICSEMGLQSEAQLTWVLAHEIGHAIDGCNCQHPRLQHSRPLVASAQTPVRDSSKPVLNEINRGQSFLRDPRDLSPDIMRIVERAQRAGHVTQVDSGMDPAQNPLNAILSCMVRKNILPRGYDVPPRGQACREKGSFSETPSDIWGARIAGLALKENPPSSDLAKLGSLSQEAIDLMCAPRTGPKPLRPLNDSSWENLLPAEGRYIDYRFRDEATFLTDPNIQRALGCEPSPRMGTCMAQFPQAMTDWGSRLPEASVPRAAPAAR